MSEVSAGDRVSTESVSRLVVHIVPQLPPAVCGLGDYATLVGGKMEELRPDVQCAYLACGARAAGTQYARQEFFGIARTFDGAALWRSIEGIDEQYAPSELAILLHYSGYGYDPAGAPAWLASAFENRPRQFAEVRLITVFHELFATGRPWERAFWHSGRQRRVAARIANASQGVATNRSASARWLEGVLPPGQLVPHLAIPSNVGEPESLVDWSKRERLAVLFGSARFKQSFLKMPILADVVEACQRCGVNRLVSIGECMTLPSDPFSKRDFEIVQTGVLPASEVSSYLQSARLAFVDYFPGYFAKSGVLGAAAAHGVPPVLLRGAVSERDGFVAGENCVTLDEMRNVATQSIPARMSEISAAISRWYSGHTLAHHARALGAACGLELQRDKVPQTEMTSTQ